MVKVTDLRAASLVDLTAALRARTVSVVELMELVLSRIDATHDTLHAVVSRRERADAPRRCARRRASASRAARRARSRESPSASRISRTSPASSRRRDRSRSATAWRRATPRRSSGCGPPARSWSARRTRPSSASPRSPRTSSTASPARPGTSSARPADRAAARPRRSPARVLPLVTASDGGGSIRIPASFTGAFGLKPSFGRIPRGPANHWGYGDTAVYGPLTKTVEDAALFLDQVVGPSPLRPEQPAAPRPLVPRRARAPPPNGKLRIGFSPDLGYAVVQSDVAAAVEDGARVLRVSRPSARARSGTGRR